MKFTFSLLVLVLSNQLVFGQSLPDTEAGYTIELNGESVAFILEKVKDSAYYVDGFPDHRYNLVLKESRKMNFFYPKRNDTVYTENIMTGEFIQEIDTSSRKTSDYFLGEITVEQILSLEENKLRLTSEDFDMELEHVWMYVTTKDGHEINLSHSVAKNLKVHPEYFETGNLFELIPGYGIEAEQFDFFSTQRIAWSIK